MSRTTLDTPALHVFALSCLAVAQPLFSILGQDPEFFVARDSPPGDIIAFAVVVTLLVPLLLISGVELVALVFGKKIGRVLYPCLLGALAAIMVLQMLRPYPSLPPLISLIIASAVATGFALASSRIAQMRQYLGILAVFAIVLPMVFLFSTPIKGLLQPTSATATTVETVEAERPVPLVLIVFDELPTSSLLNAEHLIDPVLFPNFAAFQNSSLWYRNATAVATLTLKALPPIVTGRYPQDHLLATYRDHPQSLFTLLPNSYDFHILESRTQLCPPSRCPPLRPRATTRAAALASDLALVYLHMTLPQELGLHLPSISTHWDFAHHNDKATQWRNYVAGIGGQRKPGLYFVHSELPHHPWIYFPSGRPYHPGSELYADGLEVELGAASPSWVDDTWPVIQAYQRHLLQLRFTDRLFGELIERLKTVGLYDEALIIVTADHGISFKPGEPFRTISQTNYADILSVPLLLKLPGQTEGRIDDREAQAVDILPTIADVLHAPLKGPLDGHSLLAKAAPNRPTKFVFHSETEKLEIPDPLMPGKYRTLNTKLSYFGSQQTQNTLYRIGPGRRELLDRPLTAFEVRRDTTRTAEFDQIHRLTKIDAEAGSPLPGRVTGRLLEVPGPASEAEARSLLALVLDGTVRALTLTRIEPELLGHFSLMVPEDHLTPGPHTAGLFMVEPGDGGPEFTPVTTGPAVHYRLIEDRDGDQIFASNGHSYQIVPRLFDGSVVDFLYRGRSFRVEFLGWAETRPDGLPASEIVVFVDGEMIHAGRPNLADDPSRFRFQLNDHQESGFIFFLPSKQLHGRIRFFALSPQSTASELRYEQNARPREHVSF
jgi:hypothetical protein